MMMYMVRKSKDTNVKESIAVKTTHTRFTHATPKMLFRLGNIIVPVYAIAVPLFDVQYMFVSTIGRGFLDINRNTTTFATYVHYIAAVLFVAIVLMWVCGMYRSL